MRRPFGHFFLANALLGATTGQGNGLLGGLLTTKSSIKATFSVVATASLHIASSSAVPSMSATTGGIVNSLLGVNIGSSSILPRTSTIATPATTSILNGILDIIIGSSSVLPSATAITTPSTTSIFNGLPGLSISRSTVPSTSSNAAPVPSASLNTGSSSMIYSTSATIALSTNGLVGGLLGGLLGISTSSVSILPSTRATVVPTMSGILDGVLGLTSGKSSTTSNANTSPTAGSSEPSGLAGLDGVLVGAGGAIGNVASGLDSAVGAIVTPIASGVGSTVTPIASSIGSVVGNIVSNVDSVVNAVTTPAAPTITNSVNAVGTVVGGIVSNIESLVDALITPLASNAASIMAGAGAASNINSVVEVIVTPVPSNVNNAVNSVGTLVGGVMSDMNSTIAVMVTPAASGVSNTANPVGMFLGGLVSNVNSIVSVIATPTASSMPNVIEPVKTIIGDLVSNVDSIVAVIATPIATEVQVIASKVAQVIEGVGQNASAVASNILSEVQLLASSVTQVVNSVGQSTVPTAVITQSAIPGVGIIATNLGNNTNVIKANVTEMVVGLSNITLNTVKPVLTNATLPMLSSAPAQLSDELLGALLHPHPRDPDILGWQYFGCFSSSIYLTTQATLQATNPSALMNASICIDLCIQKGMDFSTATGSKCYCSNTAPGINSGSNNGIGINQCESLCPGSLKEYCGGNSTGSDAVFSTFKRVVSLVQFPEPASPANWTYNSCSYLGDWLDSLTSQNYYSAIPSGGTDGVECSALCYAESIVQDILYTVAIVSDDACYCSTITPDVSLWAGIGECSTPCNDDASQSCGGTSKLGAKLGISYVRQPAAPSTAPTLPGAIMPMSWYSWGCYYGAAYLLETMLTGFQASSLLDPLSSVDGDTCIARCIAADESYSYAMVVGGLCFCNDKAPSKDLQAVSQLTCNIPCPNNPLQRCGGNAPGSSPGRSAPKGRNLVNVYSAEEAPAEEPTTDEPPKVSGLSICSLLFSCSGKVCSALCAANLLCAILPRRKIHDEGMGRLWTIPAAIYSQVFRKYLSAVCMSSLLSVDGWKRLKVVRCTVENSTGHSIQLVQLLSFSSRLIYGIESSRASSSSNSIPVPSCEQLSSFERQCRGRTSIFQDLFLRPKVALMTCMG
ncbi:hypothetical protein HBH56_099980 [Parastagonospora nodorum]|uniref:WSC domain-containing protein n=1 Tax=Phaeosphaeria nodorum (strain SN15 / ATCC MYA-4574 / FGSC 10173) TaxID=321614 RepID=A0A7U2ICV4_PHANO|nr:hypothetical protein HBH56_099980 [Parastagonospora nodorum]QRD07496.1 hypothetical protein JI435_131170 [Parastagonospora nodorum SN15]KAH3930290.1 hypothetical protein HBH54_114300 [Parastagonospora nodorum]KAH4051006.1 hypothetical protein HBH49_126440 [Parastagonospora nodorum]KAH4093361.1 hypothetical protein HBH46_179760 [Parastagonospora nodorum]